MAPPTCGCKVSVSLRGHVRFREHAMMESQPMLSLPRLACILAIAGLITPGATLAAKPRGQDELARITAGRVAGEPLRCITIRQITTSRIIDGTAIVFETAGGTLYVNTPPLGATQLDSSKTLIIDTHTPELCNIDTIRLRDMSLRMDAGFVGLGMFVPYTRPRR
jgi:hypothetical protein